MKLSSISQVLSKCEYDKSNFSHILDSSFFTFGDSDKYKIEIASDLKTRMEAFQLMYKLYRDPALNYAKEDPSKMWYSIFNASPYTKTIVVRDLLSRKSVATVTVVLDTKLGLPLEENYPLHIRAFREKKCLCAEIISLGFEEEVRGSSEILIQLFKFSYLIYRGIYSVTDFLIMIKPSHSQFYEKKLFFSAIGEKVNCIKINNKPVVLFHLNLEKAQEKAQKALLSEIVLKKDDCEEIFKSFIKVQKNNKFMESLKQKVQQSEMTCEELEFFFIQKKNIFKNLQTNDLFQLSELYRNKHAKFLLKNQAQLHETNFLLV
jgi:hypothetical protein